MGRNAVLVNQNVENLLVSLRLSTKPWENRPFSTQSFQHFQHFKMWKTREDHFVKRLLAREKAIFGDNFTRFGQYVKTGFFVS